MADILSREARSALMSRVRGRDTKPELTVRRLVHSSGWRYRLYDGALPGRPDLVFRGKRAAIFVHGCFWHGHPGCKLATMPKTRTAFWSDKIDANRRRDAAVIARLQALGWRVLVIWECETHAPEHLLQKLRVFLTAAAASTSRCPPRIGGAAHGPTDQNLPESSIGKRSGEPGRRHEHELGEGRSLQPR
jgi:DNA mismatch endonuclease (patch repair protein)